MDPEAYDWLPQGDAGVREKWLGTFTERNFRIGFLRLDAGAVYQAGQFPSIEILFQTKGQVIAGGEKYGPETGYEFLANEGPVPSRPSSPPNSSAWCSTILSRNTVRTRRPRRTLLAPRPAIRWGVTTSRSGLASCAVARPDRCSDPTAPVAGFARRLTIRDGRATSTAALSPSGVLRWSLLPA